MKGSTSATTTAGGPSSPLLTPVKVGDLQLSHRLVMSAMTRTRMAPGSEAPRALNVEYYRQRTSPGGLIVTECNHISAAGRAYVRAPGLYKPEQIEGWKSVVNAVHEAGGVIFAQIFHPGRVSHNSLLPDGVQVVAPSALGMSGLVYVEGGVKMQYSLPRALETEEVAVVVQQFTEAAVAAVEECGFDGVEIHGGNGYLIQQFLAAATNQRDDQYGGSLKNRCRLLLELVDAISGKIGSQRTAVKLQPGVTFSELIEPEGDVAAQLDYLGPALSGRKLAYVCCSSLNGPPYFKFAGLEKPNVSFDVYKRFRETFSGTLMINGGLNIESAVEYLQDGCADLASFGCLFLANANLPELVAAGIATDSLNPGGFDTKTWYSKDPAKDALFYTDWPLVNPTAAIVG